MKRFSRHSVVFRVIVATALVAAAIGVTLALFFAANSKLESANTDSAHAAAINSAASDLRTQVFRLSDALHAAIATKNPAFVSRWRSTETAWRAPADQLLRATASSPSQQQRVRVLQTHIESYVADYGDLLVSIAHFSPSAAKSSDANAEGELRLDEILRDTDGIARSAAAVAVRKSASANRLAHRATVAGLVALGLTPLLLIALGIWLAHAVADPLRKVVGAASAVAAGDFDVRVDAARSDEFGELGVAFNAMTESLSTSRRELIERADHFERSERHKTELISMVSHEVRTPLASVLGFTRLLLDRDLNEEDRRRYLEIVDSEATRLAELVSDILDARLLEEGQFALRRERFDLRSVVREQAELALGHDGSHRLELEVQDAPLDVDADRGRLAQVVGNILSNAVKFSPAGAKITVGAREAAGYARIWVDDEGEGIPPEHAMQIFEPFYRGDAASAGIPGTGLGLAVSRRIVEAHEGHIGFEPLPEGTRFWIELPQD